MKSYEDKYLKYKTKYFNLKNQLGGGWKLYYDEKNGRPYYENEKGDKKWAGYDKGEFSTWNGYPGQIIISWLPDPKDLESFKYKREDPYYDKNTGEYYQYKVNKSNKEDRKLLGSSKTYITSADGRKEKAYRSAKDIWPIDEELKKQLFPPNDSPFKFDVQITEKKDEYDSFESNIEYQKFSTSPGLIQFADTWLNLMHNPPVNKELRIYKPNRILVYGGLGPTVDFYGNSTKQGDNISFVPMLYYEQSSKIDENLKKIIIDSLSDNELEREEIKNKLNLFNEYITKDKPIWIKLSWGYNIFCTFNGSDINIELVQAYADYLVPGYLKVMTCFMIKFLKEKYPLMNINKIELSDRTGGAWVKHGFEKIENVTSSMTHIYNFEKGSTICNEVKTKFDIDNILYYDFTKVYE